MIHSFPSLYCIDCRLMAQFSMFLCPLDIDTWVQRFEQTFGKTVRFSLFVTSAKLDTGCLDPVIYCGLESILMLSFLFCVLLGTFFVKEMFPHICDLVNQW